MTGDRQKRQEVTVGVQVLVRTCVIQPEEGPGDLTGFQLLIVACQECFGYFGCKLWCNEHLLFVGPEPCVRTLRLELIGWQEQEVSVV